MAELACLGGTSTSRQNSSELRALFNTPAADTVRHPGLRTCTAASVSCSAAAGAEPPFAQPRPRPGRCKGVNCQPAVVHRARSSTAAGARDVSECSFGLTHLSGGSGSCSCFAAGGAVCCWSSAWRKGCPPHKQWIYQVFSLSGFPGCSPGALCLCEGVLVPPAILIPRSEPLEPQGCQTAADGRCWGAAS